MPCDQRHADTASALQPSLESCPTGMLCHLTQTHATVDGAAAQLAARDHLHKLELEISGERLRFLFINFPLLGEQPTFLGVVEN